MKAAAVPGRSRIFSAES